MALHVRGDRGLHSGGVRLGFIGITSRPIGCEVYVGEGHYELLTYGLPARGLPECSRRMSERYGIAVRPIAGCIVSRSLMAYADAHNQIVMDEIRRKFGHDVLQKCMSDVNSQASASVTAH